ncbi:class I SAM-dependent methyltransferase [Gaiella sp.]|uniref:class I SAM-dependent methyltransferase n=1 Tax=Gaiella sp. TaxID=2663207 RepID=UPI002C18AB7A|nr:class I SAM-dependent methyltransferase [Gaiella sp.]HWO79831.1 class I SAM-dependent methyltransferase [Gaiella sp.]
MEPVRPVPPPRRPDPPRAESTKAAVELASLLRDAGYESPRIQQRLATGDELLARSPELPSYLRRLGDGDELAVLLRLFLLGVPVERARLELLVPERLRQRLAGAELLVDDAGLVHGTARLVPHDDLLIASDPAGAAEGHADHVAGVHRPSVALAHLTVRGEEERALDLCAGNGIQAILLAAHASHVVATDVNTRALAYATFNAALNDVANVEVRAGSFFEPVEGERFDLVVANPPYVVSPESAYLFRDSGLRGDAVSELVVRGTPALLAPGAFASVLIAWALDPDDPAARPRQWLEGSGCDAFLLHTSTDDPLETATVWNRDLLDRPDAYSGALDRWLAYYHELGIEQLGYACLVLRKRNDSRDSSAAGWMEALQLPRAALRPAGRHVRRLFETHDRLDELDSDAALLGRRLRVVDDAVVSQDTRFSGGRWQSEQLTLRLEHGLPFSAELDPSTARLVRELDGSRTLAEALATAVGGDAAGEGLGLARRMLEVGFLELD